VVNVMGVGVSIGRVAGESDGGVVEIKITLVVYVGSCMGRWVRF